MDEQPFSVWQFSADRVEDRVIVSWREEYENGTRPVRVVVRTAEEFGKQVDRFSRLVRATWPIL